jgi:fructose-1,6-bisphosphatase/sedoheptulose 1,7-bisphosphatase-like protein
MSEIKEDPSRNLGLDLVRGTEVATLSAARWIGLGQLDEADQAATPNSSVDLLMGIGGVPQGVIATCAVKVLGGAMLGRLAPQSDEERQAIERAGLDTRRVLVGDELITSNKIFLLLLASLMDLYLAVFVTRVIELKLTPLLSARKRTPAAIFIPSM